MDSKALSFDDVLLVPNFSNIGSRKNVDISTNLFGLDVQPILSANMPSVTNGVLARAMLNENCHPVLHRFNSVTEAESEFKWVGSPACGVSIGVKEEDRFRAQALYDIGARIFFIDIAHGHHSNMAKMIDYLKSNYSDVQICAGNVGTYEGASYLASAGADVIKVGIGPGAACITREVTGFGIPQLGAIWECSEIKKFADVKIIADGGIRTSGDIVKALYFGADAVMIGSILAGADESPSPGQYWGNASHKINGHNAPEGVNGRVERRGSVKEIIKTLSWGIKSGFSYAGARNVDELRENAEFTIVTPNSLSESRARV